jgi:hypothetical protein
MKSIRSKYDNRLAITLRTLQLNEGIALIDVGAAGDIEPRWKGIQEFISYIGFEPDERSRSALILKPQNCFSYTIRPEALGKNNDEKVPFYLCEKEQVSSLHYPRTNFLKLFPDSRRFNVVKNSTVILKSLDALKIQRVDFIKLDTQGSELDILQGSTLTLGKVYGLEIEVEFIKLYQGQALFGDIADFLAPLGFEFIDFTNLCRWQRDRYDGLGQCVFGNALFLKTPETVAKESSTNSELSSYLACLLIYHRYDLILQTINLLSDDQKKVFADFHSALEDVERHFAYAVKVNRFFGSLAQQILGNIKSHFIY